MELPDFFSFIADFIQLYALNDDPSMLMMKSGWGERGVIAIADGRVIHAVAGPSEGEDALYRIMRWQRGEISRRVVKRSVHSTIDTDLSTLLMNAYDEVMKKGALSSDGDDDLPTENISLENTLSEISELVPHIDVRQTLTGHDAAYQQYLRLVWGETLRKELKSIDGLVSYQVIDIDLDSRSLHSTTVDARAQSLASDLILAMKNNEVPQDQLELYLSYGDRYHVMVSLPVKNHTLHALFSRKHTTPAMIQFKIKQAIEKLPQSHH